MTVKVINNIDLNERRPGIPPCPWGTIGVGDGFELTAEQIGASTIGSIRTMASRNGRILGRSFAVAKQRDGSVRVKRVG